MDVSFSSLLIFPQASIEQVCDQLDQALEAYFLSSQAHALREQWEQLSVECGRFYFQLAIDDTMLTEEQKQSVERQNALWAESQKQIAPVLIAIQKNMNAVMSYAQVKIQSGHTDYEYSKEFAQAIGVLWDKYNILFEYLKLPARFKAMTLENGPLYHHDFREGFVMPIQDPQDTMSVNTLGQYLFFQDLFYPMRQKHNNSLDSTLSDFEREPLLFPESDPDHTWGTFNISQALASFDVEQPIPLLDRRKQHAQMLGLSDTYSGLLYTSNRLYYRNLLLMALSQDGTITYDTLSRTYALKGDNLSIEDIDEQALYDVLIYLKAMPPFPRNRMMSSKANALYCQSIISDISELLKKDLDPNLCEQLNEAVVFLQQCSNQGGNCLDQIDAYFLNLAQNPDLDPFLGSLLARNLQSQDQTDFPNQEESQEEEELLAQFDSEGAQLMTRLNALPIQALVCTHDPINHASIDCTIATESFFVKKNDDSCPLFYAPQIFSQALAYACGENAYSAKLYPKLLYQLSDISENALFWHLPQQQQWISKVRSFLGYPADASLHDMIADLARLSSKDKNTFLKDVETALKACSEEYDSHSFESLFSMPFLKKIDEDIITFLQDSSQKSWDYFSQNPRHAQLYDRVVLERLNSFLKKREALIHYAIRHRMQAQWQKEALSLSCDYESYVAQQLIKHRIPFKTPMVLLSTLDYPKGQSLTPCYDLKKPNCEKRTLSAWNRFWLAVQRFLKKALLFLESRVRKLRK